MALFDSWSLPSTKVHVKVLATTCKAYISRLLEEGHNERLMEQIHSRRGKCLFGVDQRCTHMHQSDE